MVKVKVNVGNEDLQQLRVSVCQCNSEQAGVSLRNGGGEKFRLRLGNSNDPERNVFDCLIS